MKKTLLYCALIVLPSISQASEVSCPQDIKDRAAVEKSRLAPVCGKDKEKEGPIVKRLKPRLEQYSNACAKAVGATGREAVGANQQAERLFRRVAVDCQEYRKAVEILSACANGAPLQLPKMGGDSQASKITDVSNVHRKVVENLNKVDVVVSSARSAATNKDGTNGEVGGKHAEKLIEQLRKEGQQFAQVAGTAQPAQKTPEYWKNVGMCKSFGSELDNAKKQLGQYMYSPYHKYGQWLGTRSAQLKQESQSRLAYVNELDKKAAALGAGNGSWDVNPKPSAQATTPKPATMSNDLKKRLEAAKAVSPKSVGDSVPVATPILNGKGANTGKYAPPRAPASK